MSNNRYKVFPLFYADSVVTYIQYLISAHNIIQYAMIKYGLSIPGLIHDVTCYPGDPCSVLMLLK